MYTDKVQGRQSRPIRRIVCQHAYHDKSSWQLYCVRLGLQTATSPAQKSIIYMCAGTNNKYALTLQLQGVQSTTIRVGKYKLKFGKGDYPPAAVESAC